MKHFSKTALFALATAIAVGGAGCAAQIDDPSVDDVAAADIDTSEDTALATEATVDDEVADKATDESSDALAIKEEDTDESSDALSNQWWWGRRGGWWGGWRGGWWG